MNKVPVYIASISTGQTGTASMIIQKADQFLVYIPAVASKFASSAVKMTLEVSPASGTSTRTQYFYDFINFTPVECAATISTAGVYELPQAGGGEICRVSFDIATTQAVTLQLMTPKTSF